MSSAKRFSVLRDPVHGDVYLTHEELAVLDTPEMQRLRGVKQLGTAYLVRSFHHQLMAEALFSMYSSSRPIRIFKEEKEAVDWLGTFG